jgi:hypothetical protein
MISGKMSLDQQSTACFIFLLLQNNMIFVGKQCRSKPDSVPFPRTRLKLWLLLLPHWSSLHFIAFNGRVEGMRFPTGSMIMGGDSPNHLPIWLQWDYAVRKNDILFP